MELTRDDIELLMDALEALKGNKKANEMIASVMVISLSRSKGEAELFLNRIKAKSLSEMDKQKILEEQIILLKAKLIRLRDGIDVNEFISGVGQ